MREEEGAGRWAADSVFFWSSHVHRRKRGERGEEGGREERDGRRFFVETTDGARKLVHINVSGPIRVVRHRI